MKHFVVRSIAVALLSLTGTVGFAADHTWISTPSVNGSKQDSSSSSDAKTEPRALNGSTDSETLPTVYITGSTIGWGSGYFDEPFNEIYTSMGSGSIGTGIAGSRDRAVDLSDVCTNPLISSASKTTTSTSDATTRWLAAQDMFITTMTSNLLTSYAQAMRISILLDGKYYRGYKVSYADGGSEVWVVNPGYATSSFKLFDTPAPGSLKGPDARHTGCQG
jgi:hypothetical protein